MKVSEPSHDPDRRAPTSTPCRVSLDRSGDEPVSSAIVSVVASLEGTDPTELSPLYSVVDPDALESLFATGDAPARGVTRVAFEYEGYDLTITASGQLYFDARLD